MENVKNARGIACARKPYGLDDKITLRCNIFEKGSGDVALQVRNVSNIRNESMNNTSITNFSVYDNGMTVSIDYGENVTCYSHEKNDLVGRPSGKYEIVCYD